MPTEWYQQQLTPSEVFELNVRLGIIPETDHVQALVEMKDPMTGILIAQWSAPHVPVIQGRALLERALAKGAEFLDQSIEPF